ncbi:hypothetical protein LCGC14_3129440 [marine sediment metagenome]|uniref:Uncharacterized protein n=1 Tax=marine sediment metagenome TaxID=412755 RepID=A0A0F8W035_9ZZZZ
MWKKYLETRLKNKVKDKLKEWLDSDAFRDLIVTVLKSVLPDFEVTPDEKESIKEKLIAALVEFIS